MKRTVLIVDDDKALLKTLKAALTQQEYVVELADGGRAGIEKLEQRPFDVLLVDLGMPELDGFEVMKAAVQRGKARAIVVMTGQDSGRVGARAIQAGAADFITKPLDPTELDEVIRKVLNDGGDEPLEDWRRQYAPQILGNAPRLLRVLDMARRVSSTDCEVMVTGESGSGKELFAQAIHAASARSSKPFVAINCAAIPKELMESEIFGHAKGSFTGATERRDGKFHVADGGCLFLDEIGEMDLGLQAKFLRVIQEKEFTPVGETRSRKADVRIISATNRDLREQSQQGTFREDLYFRLNVIPINLPPLRERPEDIPLLVDHFVAEASRHHGRDVVGVEDDVQGIFARYPWPGNVRELRNLIERMVVLKAEMGPLRKDDLPDFLLEQAQKEPGGFKLALPETGLDINEALQSVEQQLTLEALRRTGGNKAKAAELLGLKRTTLIERLKKFSIPEA